MLLSNARLRTRRITDSEDDETDDPRFTDDEVNQELQTQQEMFCRRYAEEGGDLMDELVSVSSGSDGYVNLAVYSPLVIKAVQVNQGGIFTPMDAIFDDQVLRNDIAARTLQVRLVRYPTFPSSDSGTFLYGPGIRNETFDKTVILMAARALLGGKANELSQSIETQFAEALSVSLNDTESVMSYDLGYDASSFLGWLTVPNGLQVVWARGGSGGF